MLGTVLVWGVLVKKNKSNDHLVVFFIQSFHLPFMNSEKGLVLPCSEASSKSFSF